jgi:hypothetical protein
MCKGSKLEMDKYSTRWLNHRTFHATIGFSNLQMPLGQLPPSNFLFTQGDDKEPIINDDDNSFCDDGANLDDDLDNEDVSENITLSSLGLPASKDGRLTYQFVVEKAQNLVRLAQTDTSRISSQIDSGMIKLLMLTLLIL